MTIYICTESLEIHIVKYLKIHVVKWILLFWKFAVDQKIYRPESAVGENRLGYYAGVGWKVASCRSKKDPGEISIKAKKVDFFFAFKLFAYSYSRNLFCFWGSKSRYLSEIYANVRRSIMYAKLIFPRFHSGSIVIMHHHNRAIRYAVYTIVAFTSDSD